MEPVLREACDNCHRRKTRCPTDASGGACANCRASGNMCVFSPRSHMGRPRRDGRKPRQRQGRPVPAPLPSSSMSPPGGRPESPLQSPLARRNDAVGGVMVDGSGGAGNTMDYCEMVGVSGEELPGSSSSGGSWDSEIELGTPANAFMTLFAPMDCHVPMSDVCPEPTAVPGQLNASAFDPSQQEAIDPVFTRAEQAPQQLGQHPHQTSQQHAHHHHQGRRPKLHPEDLKLANMAAHAHHHAMPHPSPFSPPLLTPPPLGLVEVYGELSQLLFSLHAARDIFLRDRGDRRALLRVLVLVSALCDVVTWLRRSVSGPLTGRDPSPCLLLAVSVVSVVVDIYSASLDVFRDPDSAASPPMPTPPPPALHLADTAAPEHQVGTPPFLGDGGDGGRSSSPSQPHQSSPPLAQLPHPQLQAQAGGCPNTDSGSNRCSRLVFGLPSPSLKVAVPQILPPRENTHRRLQMLSDAVAIEFQLAALGRVFAHAQLDATSCAVAPRLEDVRLQFRGLIDEWRAAP